MKKKIWSCAPKFPGFLEKKFCREKSWTQFNFFLREIFSQAKNAIWPMRIQLMTHMESHSWNCFKPHTAFWFRNTQSFDYNYKCNQFGKILELGRPHEKYFKKEFTVMKLNFVNTFFFPKTFLYSSVSDFSSSIQHLYK